MRGLSVPVSLLRYRSKVTNLGMYPEVVIMGLDSWVLVGQHEAIELRPSDLMERHGVSSA